MLSQPARAAYWSRWWWMLTFIVGSLLLIHQGLQPKTTRWKVLCFHQELVNSIAKAPPSSVSLLSNLSLLLGHMCGSSLLRWGLRLQQGKWSDQDTSRIPDSSDSSLVLRYFIKPRSQKAKIKFELKKKQPFPRPPSKIHASAYSLVLICILMYSFRIPK